MRNNHSLLSQEISDRILQQYEYLVYLLGYRETGEIPYSGLYELIEASGEAMLVNKSGIPHLSIYETIGGIDPSKSFTDIREVLKYDYIYNKIYGNISYTE